ncbi:2e58af1e-8d26-4a8a-b450-5883918190ce [Sclerotinia trifoliorum]|uniref:2e58af1e-8d26-4a8a-b450-5883918190ce n=1 Tax=Sclerotinia trifoliorum TaxID=28548 RepID=A0A8H2W3I0_9HELO|nr:2e58af1e-8d26-4a8a-b450-5883918190ce [Sclerotinia trifoliorum]
MCLRAICHYEFCGEQPYSYILYFCVDVNKGKCKSIHTVTYPVQDICPECYMLDDPRISEGFNPASLKAFEERWKFELAHFEELNALEGIDGIFARAEEYKRERVKEGERESLLVFCSELNRDVIRHLERLVNERLLTYTWSNVLNGRGQEISRERRLTILQVKAMPEMGKLRNAINAGAPWVTTVVTDPALLKEYCVICKMEPLSSKTTVQLPCSHMYHEECLKLCVETLTCPYCRSKEARGTEPKLAVPTVGPITDWLFAIHPFDRRDLRRPSPTWEENEALTDIYNDARDKAFKLSEPLGPLYRKLSGIRQRTELLERKIEPSFFDVVRKNSHNLSEAQVGRIRHAQGHNEERSVEVDHYGRKHFEAIGKVNQFDYTDFIRRNNVYQEWIYAKYLDSDEKKKQVSGKTLDALYAPLEFLPSEDVSELASLRIDEEEVVRTFYEAVDQWRVAIYARQTAEEDWTIYFGENEDEF